MPTVKAAVAGLAVAACVSGQDDVFIVPYREAPPPPLRVEGAPVSGAAGGSALPGPTAGGQPPIAPTGPAPPPPPPPGACDPAFCPSLGAGAACCTPAGECGITFGMGGCMVQPPDAGGGGGPPPVQVDCRGDADCGGRVCCGATAGGFGYSALQCQDVCGAQDTPIGCGGPADCPGEVCCGTLAGGSYASIGCAADCVNEGGTARYVLCASDGDCASGLTCQASQLLPSGFSTCR